MSSYWAGYSGTGLMLNENEFLNFLEKYKEKNPSQAEYVDDCLVNYGLDEIKFIKSVDAGEVIPNLEETDSDKYDDKIICVTDLTDDNIDGLMFWPFYHSNGQMNEDFSMDIRSCYMIWSDKSFTSPRVFERPAYNSYEEFVQEFKDKVSAYLPENFDWDVHLGCISYACYA